MKRLLCALVVTACGGVDAPAGGGTAGPAPEPGGGDSQMAEAAPCLEGAGFAVGGRLEIAARPSGVAADSVRALRWQPYEGCERLVIELGGAGPAPGAVDAEVLPDVGVVRIRAPGVAHVATDATDLTPGGELAAAAYVARSQTDGLFVDVHLAAPAEARVLVLEGPARIVVDLRPAAAGTLSARPVTGRRVVVLRPQPGAAAYPIEVRGYARTFEANVVVRLEQDGREVLERFTTAAGWLEAWGEFSLTIDSGPTGPLVMHVGEYSARDGAWEGVALELDVR